MQEQAVSIRGGFASQPAWPGHRLYELLCRRAILLTRNRADAEDLVHDTYERAMRAPVRPADQGEEATARWASRIMYNLFIDKRRHERCLSTVPWDDIEFAYKPANENGQPPSAWRTASDDDLRAHVDQLSPSLRKVLLMTQRGHGTRMIATELGIDYATVATRLFRARAKLRQSIIGSGGPASAD